MHAVVCAKQVPDTTDIRIDPVTNTLVREGVPSIMNPFDAHALEEALRLKDRHGGYVTVISMGPKQAEVVLRAALGQGADHAMLLSDRAFAGSDTLATSYILSQAVRKVWQERQVDVVICGKHAIDGDTGQVGPGIATRLGIPLLTYVQAVLDFDREKGTITVTRALEEGQEVVRAALPVLLTVTKEINEERYAALPHLIRAARATIPVWNKEFVDIDAAKAGLKGSPTSVVKSFTPPRRTRRNFIFGPGGNQPGPEDPSGLARSLLDALAEAGVLKLIAEARGNGQGGGTEGDHSVESSQSKEPGGSPENNEGDATDAQAGVGGDGAQPGSNGTPQVASPTPTGASADPGSKPQPTRDPGARAETDVAPVAPPSHQAHDGPGEGLISGEPGLRSSWPPAAPSIEELAEEPGGNGHASGNPPDGRPGLWVFVEVDSRARRPAKVSWELLGKARELAPALGAEVSCVILGHRVENLVNEAQEYGPDAIIAVDHPMLEHYRTLPYEKVLTGLIQKHSPEIFLMGATTLGRDLAGAVATTIGTGLTADCTELTVSKELGLLEQTRPAFGGNIMATILCRKHRPQMATVRPRVFPTPERLSEREDGSQGSTRLIPVVYEKVELTEADANTAIIDFMRASDERVRLQDASVVVSGGKGLGGPEPFEMLGRLASKLGGCLGASRAAVEAGWISAVHQVGQTGSTVRPILYAAVGISGTVQHQAGMQGSDYVVAINKDRNSAIFEACDFGVVGDLFEIVPALLEQLDGTET